MSDPRLGGVALEYAQYDVSGLLPIDVVKVCRSYC